MKNNKRKLYGEPLRIRGIPFNITAHDDGFNNRYNQMTLRSAANRMNEGKGTIHETVTLE